MKAFLKGLYQILINYFKLLNYDFGSKVNTKGFILIEPSEWDSGDWYRDGYHLGVVREIRWILEWWMNSGMMNEF